MPNRSFLGVGVLIGLIAGAMFGLQTGNLAFSIVGGVIVGVALALLIDWLARLRPGQGVDGGGGVFHGDFSSSRNTDHGHHGHGHGGHDGGHGGSDGGGDGGGGD